MLRWIGLAPSTYHTWKERYGKANEHNGAVPRDHWLTAQERKAIIDFHHQYPLEGYRRLTYMMIDRNIVACSPATVYRVLSQAGLLQRWKPKTSLKGTGFVQPLRPHEHWHVDVSYLNIAGTFHYLCSVLDGASRAIVHWDIRERMTEADIEQIIQKGKEVTPVSRPDHHRQRTPVPRQGLQGVHPHQRHDPRQNLALLSPKQRQNSNDSTAP
ncbi:MAG: hypothetical protein U0791_25365 [Gemmataceae bacterium]